MKKAFLSLLLLPLIILASLFHSDTLRAEDKGHVWMRVEIGIIGTASEEVLANALLQAENKACDGLLIVLDTPGGALDNTRKMVETMMASPLPVIVWVGPDGARAASAGAFITLAAHVAAMAPGTNIGAAHPIDASGGDLGHGDAGKKAENDTAAFIEAIATTRHRNRDMAVSFVVNSVAVTAQEALENKVIDLVTPSIKDLFTAVDGREVTLQNGAKITLATRAATTITYEKTLRHKLLEILGNPNLFYLLFVAGLVGIGFELTHPGILLPGVIGGICMILALMATSVLPVNFGAMILLVAAIGCMIAEGFVSSFGVLGVGGFVAFVIGSVLLVDPSNSQGLRVAWMTIAPTAIMIAGFGVYISFLVGRTFRSKVISGAEGMVGMTGEALGDFTGGKGRVMVSGENWAAVVVSGPVEIKKGDRITVCAVKGLELEIKV